MNDEDDILNEFYELIGEERDYVTKRENEELNKIYTKSMSLVDELLKNIEDETKRKKISEMMDDYNVKIDEYYDYMMSIVQVLTHFAYISTASAFEKLKVNIKETEDYESPIYNLLIDTIARIVSQNPFLTLHSN